MVPGAGDVGFLLLCSQGFSSTLAVAAVAGYRSLGLERLSEPRQQLARTADVKKRELFAHLGYRSLRAWQRASAPDAAPADRTLRRRLGDLGPPTST
jgi:hypothetical protein